MALFLLCIMLGLCSVPWESKNEVFVPSCENISLTYYPLKNIVQGNTLTLKCSGGRDIMWYYYLSNGPTAVDVTDKSLQQQTHQHHCNDTIWISTLTMTLTKQINMFRVRCTTRAFMPANEDRRGFMETQPIHVLYNPTTATITRVPDYVQLEEGVLNLTLTCYADGNPGPSYRWLFQSIDQSIGATFLKNEIFARGKDMRPTEGNLCDTFILSSQDKDCTQYLMFDSNSIMGTNHELVLRDLTVNQTGIYTCAAYNRINHKCHGVTRGVGIVVGPRSKQFGLEIQEQTTAVSNSRNDMVVIVCITLGLTSTFIAIVVVLAVCLRRTSATTASVKQQVDVGIQTDVGPSENNSPKRVYKCLDGQISVEEAYDVEWMTL